MTTTNATATRTSRPNSSTRRRIIATWEATIGTDCAACGRDTIVGGPMTDGRTLNMGHVVADANGGTGHISNMLPICRRCNVYMGDRDWQDSGAPMRCAPVPAVTMPDPGSGESYMDAPDWA